MSDGMMWRRSYEDDVTARIGNLAHVRKISADHSGGVTPKVPGAGNLTQVGEVPR